MPVIHLLNNFFDSSSNVSDTCEMSEMSEMSELSEMSEMSEQGSDVARWNRKKLFNRWVSEWVSGMESFPNY